ncbi:hypothetical protein CU669_16880 [Paramagnetospirillum kuznetsovii]|uniref:Zinc finger CHC2-type domain-containing protein n=1 Tax=Paramagnetospirillum kuznetsovii TaxID=2053833 RepID=A0A364NUL3_9PROT|nr:CHC2 zinc finger domain-containing protein [Paramagnetospirillum kuznetsovii]RAU20756.1 hypothetical protein CU669_16880 [Paramagnetospirillum kuznetsovii]
MTESSRDPSIDAAIESLKQSLNIVEIISSRGIQLKRQGAEHVGLCPFHEDTKASLSVNPQKGVYYCRACGAAGTAIRFLQEYEARSFADVVYELSNGGIDLRRRSGSLVAATYERTAMRTTSSSKPTTPEPKAILPVPASAEDIVATASGFSDLGAKTPKSVKILNPNNEDCPVFDQNITMQHTYCDANGELLGYVLRNDWVDAEGVKRKSTKQVVWAEEVHMPDGSIRSGWTSMAFPPPRQPYGRELVNPNPNALCAWFEGEKAVDYANERLGQAAYVGMGWVGGAGAVDKLALDPEVAGRDHILCPDNDPAGHVCMQKLERQLRDAGCTGDIYVALAPEGAAKGWDAADSCWNAEQLTRWLGAAIPYTEWKSDMAEVETVEMERVADAIQPSLTTPAAAPNLADVPHDGITIYDRICNQGPAVLEEPATLQILGRMRKSNKSGYGAFRVAMRAIGMDVSSMEERINLALAGLTKDGMLIHGLAKNDPASLQDGPVVQMLVRMKACERTAYVQLKKELSKIGVPSDEMDKAVTLAARENDGGMSDRVNGLLHDFKITIQRMGYHRGVYFYLSSETREIVSMSAEKHRDRNLLQLAPAGFWELAFGTEKGGINWIDAASWLMRDCHQKGLFENERIRGRGVWFDNGRTVMHLGDRLIIDGETCKIEDYCGSYHYEINNTLPAPLMDDPLTDEEGREIADIIYSGLRWENQGHGYLLIGWIVSAMVGGAMPWRPHVWLSGPSGSGKTWTQTMIISPLLGSLTLAFKGATEAAIRGKLQSDSLAVLFDEAESQTERTKKQMEAVLGLARTSSSGTTNSGPIDDPSNEKKDNDFCVGRGTQGGGSVSYQIRSSFLFSSISPALEQEADINRFMQLPFRKPLKFIQNSESNRIKYEEESANFERTKKRVEAAVKNGVTSRRLLARILQNLPTILENVENFRAAASDVLMDSRNGDTVGVLLACYHAIITKAMISKDEAKTFMLENKDIYVKHIDDTSSSSNESRCLNIIKAYKLDVYGKLSVLDCILAAQKLSSGKLYDEPYEDLEKKLSDAERQFRQERRKRERVIAIEAVNVLGDFGMKYSPSEDYGYDYDLNKVISGPAVLFNKMSVDIWNKALAGTQWDTELKWRIAICTMPNTVDYIIDQKTGSAKLAKNKRPCDIKRRYRDHDQAGAMRSIAMSFRTFVGGLTAEEEIEESLADELPELEAAFADEAVA